jgi:outer membrane receptor protein involved in Fe transport
VNRPFTRVSCWLLAGAIALSFVAPAGAATPGASPGSINGTVADASSGVPIANVDVRVVGTTVATHTDASGRFTIASLAPGSYVLSLAREGYQPAISEPIPVGATTVVATLTMHQGTTGLNVIAVTSARSSDSLQQSSTFTKTLNPETLQQQGIVRAADALRVLPGVNNGITGDTASPSDDVNLSIRGIGTLETEAAIDGHPIAYGIKGGYNYQLSPVYPYRDISVLYGSGGSDLVGVNAIGGVVNFQTLDPTPAQIVTFTQGFGSFEQLSSSLTATGTSGRLGYAVTYGVSGLNGPLRNIDMYQAGAAFDQSVLSGPIHDLGTYTDDSGASTRADLVKLRYSFSPRSTLTATSISQNRWVNKTGNGDGDYLNYAPALAFGKQLLSGYSPANYPKLPACPKGTFVGTNTNGSPNGYGPNGLPDGGTTCQTPQQYAYFNTGWDGAGPSWQSLKLNDNTLDYRYAGDHSIIKASVYNSYYENLTDRTFQLPFFTAPGDNASWSNIAANETGAIVSDDLLGTNNDIELGSSYLNTSYFTYSDNNLKGAPVISETSYFLRDVYHPSESPLAAYANLWAKHSTATDTSYLDSRLSVVYRLTPHDQLRASAGSTTTQPSANMIGQQFIESFSSGAGGGSAVTCGGLNAIGSAPSTLLKPETGVDEDVAYVHRWQGDTQTQLTLYNTNVFDKLYSTIIPLSESGTGFIPPAYLAQVTAAVAGKCGAPLAPSLLGVTGNFNVGTLRAQGFDLSGRYRATRRLFFDYDWALTSTVLVGANTQLLQKTTTLIQDDQLPRLPLHTFNGSADFTLGNGLDLRYTLYAVSTNNTKALPAYDYSDFSAGLPLGKGGRITATVLNAFNQWGSIAGLRYQGVPLPLNAYAKPSAYAQYVGASSTEQFGLPYRTIYFSYQISR